MAASAQIYDRPVLRIAVENVSGLPAGLEAELAQGQRFELVRGNKVIAEVRAPEADPEAQQPRVTAATFDWEAQRRQMWGDRVFDVDTTEWIREDRDGRG